MLKEPSFSVVVVALVVVVGDFVVLVVVTVVVVVDAVVVASVMLVVVASVVVVVFWVVVVENVEVALEVDVVAFYVKTFSYNICLYVQIVRLLFLPGTWKNM